MGFSVSFGFCLPFFVSGEYGRKNTWQEGFIQRKAIDWIHSNILYMAEFLDIYTLKVEGLYI